MGLLQNAQLFSGLKMNKDLQGKLFQKYPTIFSRRKLSKQETAMHYGICCGDGWYQLIDCLCEKINEIIRSKNIAYENHLARQEEDDSDEELTRSWGYERHPEVKADQVKSKFGGLRFYLHSYNVSSEIKGAISMAEKMSRYICEHTGEQKESNEINSRRFLNVLNKQKTEKGET